MTQLPENVIAERLRSERGNWFFGPRVEVPTGLAALHGGRRLEAGKHALPDGDEVILFRDGEFDITCRVVDLIVDGVQLAQVEIAQLLCVEDPSRLRNLESPGGQITLEDIVKQALTDLRLLLPNVLAQYGLVAIRDNEVVRAQAEHALERELTGTWQILGVAFPRPGAVAFRAIEFENDALAILRIRETQLREFTEEQKVLEGEALVRAKEREVAIRLELEKLEQQLRAQQMEMAHELRQAEAREQEWCPVGQHYRPRVEFFECANPRCRRLVCSSHLDVRGCDYVQGRVCRDCGEAWRQERDRAAQGHQPCAECGRFIRREESFVCKGCGRAGLCMTSCFDRDLRVCVTCALAAADPDPKSALRVPRYSTADLTQLMHVAQEPGHIRVRIWCSTPAETLLGQMRDISTIDARQVTALRTGDTVSFSIQADRRCYLALFSLGPTGNVTQLLPNYWRRSGLMRPNTTWILPDPLMQQDFSFRVTPPSGWERVVVIGTIEPLSVPWMSELSPAQPFHHVPATEAAIIWERLDERLCALPRSEWGMGSCEFKHAS